MSGEGVASGPPLRSLLLRRLFLIAAMVFVFNSLAVGIYYGTDRRSLEAEIVAGQVDDFSRALEEGSLAEDAAVRRLFADHPASYAFALVDRSGAVIESMNESLIPPSAKDVYADDWITRIPSGSIPMLVSGHEFTGSADGLRLVFVMRDDPAGLFWRAYAAEFYGHVWLPILPLVILLAAADFFLIRRGLAPVAAVAQWARNLKPGAPVSPPTASLPAEIHDLVDATQRSVERLAHALDAEKRLAAEAAHALRTPVAVLMARADALPPGETKDRIRSDVSDLSQTVRQVLAASRAESLEADTPQEVDLRLSVETVVATLAPFAYDKGVELVLDVQGQGQGQEQGQGLNIDANPEAVELALSNLIENAIIHGGPGVVEITLEPGPLLRVRDHGPGIPQGMEAELFKPFWRGADVAPGGAGLGLAIVERMQRAHGAEIAVANAEGGGAEFRLSWPARKT